MYGPLLKQLASEGTIISSHSTAKSAIAFLHGNPARVVVTSDNAIFDKKNLDLLLTLVEYVKTGGVLILGAGLGNYVNRGNLDKVLQDRFGVAWRCASYHRSTYFLNSANPFVAKLGAGGIRLAESYSQKAVTLKHVAPEDALYLPGPTSQTESHVFPAAPVPADECPAAIKKIGAGILAYVGDVNADEGSVILEAALLRLIS